MFGRVHFRKIIRSPFKTIRHTYLNRSFRSGCCFRKSLPSDGLELKDFFVNSSNCNALVTDITETVPYLNPSSLQGWNRKVYFDVYGCQMNVNDTEIVWSILQSAGFLKTNRIKEADIILVMTCAIRESAETKIWNRIQHLRGLKRTNLKNKPQLKIGILGCMAERLKERLIEKEKAIDIVAGPDSYKDLPRLLALTDNNQVAVNVLLSQDETYADITPVRLNTNSVTAYVSIMRGCDNMCTYCIVPFTRGKERSRPSTSIIKEVSMLSEQGYKEVTLLGQNVNSYRDISLDVDGDNSTKMAKGFKTVYKTKKGGLRFARLLKEVASIDPQMRIRFTSPHPKDFPDEVIAEHRNVCSSLHLPVQSGNNEILERMRRGYTRESYLELIDHVRSMIPEVTISSDFICGFCGETERQFEDTLSLIEKVGYHVAYLFAYSMREKTTAFRRFEDDVPSEVKQERLIKMVAAYRKRATELNRKFIGDEQTVLIEGESKRSKTFLAGRNDGNIKVIIPSCNIPSFKGSQDLAEIKSGDYVRVLINEANSQVLKGTPLFLTKLS
ncbi:CDK5RAP1-like protein isoform X2 [Rhodnius prolixus]|uniref:CDK5RAP1-like protein isoform X2 n=1 Tax=Rhodnius prolixus TaxID=13249 RepID=UPI003D18CB0F